MFGKPASLAPVVEKASGQASKKVVDANSQVDALSEQINRLSRQKSYYEKRSALLEEAAAISLQIDNLDVEYADVK